MRLNLSPTERLLLYCARGIQRTLDKETKDNIKSLLNTQIKDKIQSLLKKHTENNIQGLLQSKDNIKSIPKDIQSLRKKQTEENIQSLLKDKINWHDFISRVKFLGIAPNCHLLLKQFTNQVPQPIQNRLEELFARNAAQNMKLWSILKEILQSFNQAKIDVIPLKGPFLSQYLHGSIGFRSSSDIDLLIHREDFLRAKEVLAAKGYSRIKLLPYTEKFSRDFRRHEQFQGTDSSRHLPLVELHWNFYIASPREYDMLPVWKSAVPAKTENVTYLSLSPTFTLIHLAINLRLHGYLNLKQFSDLDALLSRTHPEISWGQVINQVTANRQRVGLFYALYMAKELLGTAIPPDILNQIRPGWLQNKIVLWVVKPWRILSSEKDTATKAYWDMVRLITSDSLKDALTIVKSTAFSHPQDLMARYEIRAASSNSFIYLLLQPLYLAWRAGKILLSLMRKRIQR